MASAADAHQRNGMGELSFPEDNTVLLKPFLLLQRQKLQSERPIWSILVPVSPILLWLTGWSLLLYPLGWILLGKYRQEFQEDWHQRRADDPDAWMLRAAVKILDALAIWVIDVCPKVTAAILLFHIGMCLAYLSWTLVFATSRETNETNHEKED